MKIVKFENGKYGVRKWSFLFGFIFCTPNLNFCTKESAVAAGFIIEYDSLDKANSIMQEALNNEKRSKDNGRALSRE